VIEVTPTDLEIERNSSAVGLVVGGKYPVSTLWLGLLLQSGNDAANALARVGGGDGGVAGTMIAMNTQAHRLGALDTHAATPSGLDGPGQFTSVYDLALIARACFARDDFRQYDTTPNVQMPAQPPKGRAFQIQNENKLLTQYPGAMGGKTGFTELARHTYVGAAQRNGRRLVVTILGAEALPVRAWQQGAALLDWGFATPPDVAVGRLVNPGETDPRTLPSDPPPAAGVLDARAGAQSNKLAASAGLNASSAAISGGAAAAACLVLLAVTMIRRRRVIRRRALRRLAATAALDH
jgi:D-alanyl-D-alanine carboxypeptidase (penicillin-binding protein 5/6)